MNEAGIRKGRWTERITPFFTGREALLDAVAKGLASGQPVVLTQGAPGLGGAGKTQTALAYAAVHAAKYRQILWVDAGEPAALTGEMAGLARELGLTFPPGADQQAAAAGVVEWLRQNQGWLLVLDNAVDADSVRPYLLPGGGGHVLITSRNPHWSGIAQTIPVPPMTRAEALAFLARRTGLTPSELEQPAQLLGDLPLALALAGAAMAAGGLASDTYVTQFERVQQELSRRVAPFTEYPPAVAVACEIALQQVRKALPAAGDLLQLCVFFGAREIPLAVLADQADRLPRTLGAALASPDAALTLRRLALAEPGSDSLTIHPAVQAAVRDKLGLHGGRIWVEVALRLLNGLAAGEEEALDGLLAHALAAGGHAIAMKVAAEPAAALWERIGMLLENQGELAQARAALERALAVGKSAYGPTHGGLADLQRRLGQVLLRLGDLSGARMHCHVAISIGEKAWGPNRPEMAPALRAYGAVLEAQGDLPGAREHYERALTITERAFGPTHAGLAPYLRSLASALRKQGDAQGAVACSRRAVEVSRPGP